MTQRTDEDAVRAFWARVAPDYGLPAPPDLALATLKRSPTTGAYRVTAGDVQAVVRWRRGSLVRVDEAVLRGAKAHLFAAEAGLAPRVLFWQPGPFELGGQPVIVSEYVESPSLDRAWFREHLRQAATLLARLHRDADLTDALDALDRGQARSDCLAAARGARAALEERLVALATRDVAARRCGRAESADRASGLVRGADPAQPGRVRRTAGRAGPRGRAVGQLAGRAGWAGLSGGLGQSLAGRSRAGCGHAAVLVHRSGAVAGLPARVRDRGRFPAGRGRAADSGAHPLPAARPQPVPGGHRRLAPPGAGWISGCPGSGPGFVDEFLPDLDRLRAGRLGG